LFIWPVFHFQHERVTTENFIMKQEILSAVNFISGLLRRRKSLATDELERFSRSLYQVLLARYSDHWFPNQPCKGSAFRCIRIVEKRMDPVVSLAASDSGIAESRLQELLPSELTMWVDPNDVSYRFGEEGSIGVLLDATTGSMIERSESISAASRDVYENCRNEHLKRSELIGFPSTAIAV
jgi:protein Tob/BTG